MINAYRRGVPGNGKPFPEGSKIVKMPRPTRLSRTGTTLNAAKDYIFMAYPRGEVNGEWAGSRA
jgi:hypothetical protein